MYSHTNVTYTKYCFVFLQDFLNLKMEEQREALLFFFFFKETERREEAKKTIVPILPL